VEQGNDAAAATDVVEATAFVVRDAEGRKRVFIGDLTPRDAVARPGIAIYDEHGSERVSLMLDDTGPVLAYAVAGNTRLELGIADRNTEAVDTGAYIALLGVEGAAWRVQVGDRGVVVEP
jgi:hypothetical protein